MSPSLSFPRGWETFGVYLPPRILIADDNLSARTAVRSLLDWHGFQMCGEATNGKEAIDQVVALKPDVILLDVNMPVMSGTEAAVEIRRIAPEVKIIFFTIHDAPELMQRLHPFGHGFVWRGFEADGGFPDGFATRVSVGMSSVPAADFATADLARFTRCFPNYKRHGIRAQANHLLPAR